MPTQPRGQGRAAAFFDLDRTLIAGATAYHFGRAAYKAGVISRRQLMRDGFAHVRFRLRGSTDEETAALKERVMDAIRGVRVADLARLAPDILAGVLPRVYPQMLEQVYAHQDAGRPAYIVTAASQELSELLARVLAMDGAIGFRSEVVDGVYTGKAAGPFTYGEGKAEAMRALAAEQDFDLEASYAYSVSASDLPMLRAVGHPVAVNPDGQLEAVASAEDWEVMRFERIGPKLVVAGTTAVATLVGGLGTVLMRRRRGGRGGSTLRAPTLRRRT